MNSAAAQSRASELIGALDLEPFPNRLVRTFSDGQRRRLDMAMGMMHRPELLFLDEPTTGLDPQSRAHMWDEVRRLRVNGTTVFLTTHYLEEADALCEQLAIIDNGKIVSKGTPATLKQQIADDIISLGLDASNGARQHAGMLLCSQPLVRELHDAEQGVQVYVERGEEVLPSVLRLLDAVGLPVSTVTLARPTLDDVFLRLTGRSLRDSEQIA